MSKRGLERPFMSIKSSSTKLSDGKPMKVRDGRLTKKAIEKLKKNYRKAVRNNVNRNMASSERDSAEKRCKWR